LMEKPIQAIKPSKTAGYNHFLKFIISENKVRAPKPDNMIIDFITSGQLKLFFAE
jgi:hypothetical protein